MRVANPDPTSPLPMLDSYAPEIIAAGNAYSYAIYEHSKLPLRVFESARIATALVNGCTVCQNWRAARDANLMGLDHGVIDNGPEPDEAMYQALLGGTTGGLSAQEQLAAEYATKLGQDPKGLAVDDDLWQRLHAAFTDAQIVDMSYCIGGWMSFGRMMHVFGIDAACTIPQLARA